MKHLKLYEDYTGDECYSCEDDDRSTSQYGLDPYSPEFEEDFDEFGGDDEDYDPYQDEEDYDFSDEERFYERKSTKSKAKPDFLDFDRDGNKKESMKKALKDKSKPQAQRGSKKEVQKKFNFRRGR